MLTSPTPIPPRRRRGAYAARPPRTGEATCTLSGTASRPSRCRAGDTTVFIDPFGDMSPAASRGLQFDYPPITGVDADLLLVTHEHLDHNGVEAIGGSPVVLRSTAGRLESPIGEVLAVASEHDAAAGTERGPNTIFVFDLDGVRVCHFGDFGQAELRPEQADGARLGRPAVRPDRRRADDRRRRRRRDRAAPRRRAGSSRCTTGPSASTSWSRPTRSST